MTNENEITRGRRFELEELSQVHLADKAHKNRRWLAAVFYVDDNNQIQSGFVTCEFLHADFPIALSKLKDFMDKEYSKLFKMQEPLPLAPHLEEVFEQEEADA